MKSKIGKNGQSDVTDVSMGSLLQKILWFIVLGLLIIALYYAINSLTST